MFVAPSQLSLGSNRGLCALAVSPLGQSHGHVDGVFPDLLGDVQRQKADHKIITNALLLGSEVALGLAEIIERIALAVHTGPGLTGARASQFRHLVGLAVLIRVDSCLA